MKKFFPSEKKLIKGKVSEVYKFKNEMEAKISQKMT